MKRLVPLLVLVLWLALPGMAQNAAPGPGMQQPNGGALEAYKIAFITKRLNLTPEEAQRFWPIYNQYAAEIRQAYLAYRDNKNEILLDESLLNIRKKYNPGFSKALGPNKANDFFRAEKDFGGFVQKEMQRRQMRIQQRRPLAGER
jgi:hypothetical protein